MSYEWVKVVHILAVVAWMAGLFYLPRLFVYHADAAPNTEMSETFKIMERRLMSAIMRPAAVVTLLSGLGFLHLGVVRLGEPWLLGKLAGVVGMFLFHGLLEQHFRVFARGGQAKSGRYYRLINEIPTVLLIWIVIFVVVRPFS